MLLRKRLRTKLRPPGSRQIAALCLYLGCGIGVAFGQQTALTLGSGSTRAGSTIVLTLGIANSAGSLPTSIEWTMTYPATDIVSVATAAGPASTQASKSLTCRSVTGTTTCAVYGLNTTSISTGTLAQLTFQLASAPPDTKIAVQVSNVVSSLADGEGVASTGTGGTITVVSALPALSAFSCSPTAFSGAGSSTCTIGLSSAAGSGGLSVSTSSNNTNITVPASVSVPQGSSSAAFSAAVKAVTTAQSGILTATAGGVSKSATLSLTPSAPAPILISAVSCSPGSVASGGSASCQVQLTAPAASAVTVKLSSNNTVLTVPSSVAIGVGSTTANFTATAAQAATQQTSVITATGPNNSQVFSETVLPAASTVSIWASSATPGTAADPDASAVEVGLKFRSTVTGKVTGIRFYKGTQNTGTHVGHLWSRTGQLLATVTFSGETANGWQKATFSSPVAIQANTTYVVSYHTSVGHYASDDGYFQSKAVTNGPLQALQNGTDGGNGVYLYGSGGFPNQTWNESNYWVDVLFTAATSPALKGAQ